MTAQPAFPPADTLAAVARLPSAGSAAPSAPLAPAASRGARIDWTPVLAAALIAAAAVGAMRFMLIERIAALETGLNERPPIAVIDYGAIQEALAAGASPFDLQPAFAAVKAQAAEKSRAGYLVINRAALEAAPERLVFAAGAVLVAPPPSPSRASALFPPPAAAAPVASPALAPAPAAIPAPAQPPSRAAALSPAPAPAGAGAPPADMTDAEAAALLRAMIAAQAGGRP